MITKKVEYSKEDLELIDSLPNTYLREVFEDFLDRYYDRENTGVIVPERLENLWKTYTN